METIKEVKDWFEESYADDDNEYQVIAAEYDTGDWQGDAFVLLKKGDQYFEINGGHCSCHGLEGQWDLEETTEGALKHRYHHGHPYGAFRTCYDAVREHFNWPLGHNLNG
jgi:hypothetical protein